MFERSVEILKEGLNARAYPSVAFAIGNAEGVLYTDVMGKRQVYPSEMDADFDTLYDLASISKLVGATQVALKMIEEGKLGLFDTLGTFFDCPRDKQEITVNNLMTHTSGLSPYLGLESLDPDPTHVAQTILNYKLVYPTGTEVRYSCMGYVVLAKILEQISGKPLDVLVKEYVFDPLGMKTACYNPKSENVVTTEFREKYRNLNEGWTKGFVHDENARFQNGISGNAGIFASIKDMIRFATMLSGHGTIDGKQYLTRRMFDLAIHDETPGMSEHRGLGFQLKGDRYYTGGDMMSRGSYGHNGFTGTSLYVDLETGLYGILLTNAVHFGRDKTALLRLRRLFYNSMMNEYLRG